MSEVKIKPLMQYEVTFPTYDRDGNNQPVVDVFTADSYVHDAEPNMGASLIFYRSGNIVRHYFHLMPTKLVVTPVAEAA